MARSIGNRWLNWFALLTAGATLGLIGLGGLVTSHGAGLAVPDWPTTYGYNLFLFPVSKWVGGVFYEHTHRLWASMVGLLTTVLAVWLWRTEERAWLRKLGVIAFFGVVLQGVLGGLRVTLLQDQIGIFHALLAQLFLVLVTALALFTSRWWQRFSASPAEFVDRNGLRHVTLGVTLMIGVQLMLGATMRHQHAGLSIPDFPLAYHKLWPPMDPASLALINQHRIDANGYGSVTAFQIGLQMVHRLWALLIVLAMGASAWTIRRQCGPGTIFTRLAAAGCGLVLVQFLLGAATIWSNKAADIATAHVVVGALTLVAESMLTLLLFQAARHALVSTSAQSRDATTSRGFAPAPSVRAPV
ncbi:MAG: COX15/CtaA family protein [Limisphaerales bacterium]